MPSVHSPSSRHGSAASPASAPTTPSFFIIQEPLIPPTSGAACSSPAPSSRSPSSSPSRPHHPSRTTITNGKEPELQPQHQQQERELADDTSRTRTTRRRASRGTATSTVALYEETDDDLAQLNDNQAMTTTTTIATTTASSSSASVSVSASASASTSRVLSILTRCGSSPELPLHNSWSTTVYSSTKKRQLRLLQPSSTGMGMGASPQLSSLQRSRLIPLPVNLRNGRRKQTVDDPSHAFERAVPRLHNDTTTANGADIDEDEALAATEEKMNYEVSLTTLRQRVAGMEKQLTRSQRQVYTLEKQLTASRSETQTLVEGKAQLTRRLREVEETHRQQQHAFDTLAERYAHAHAHVVKLTDAASAASQLEPTQRSVASVHSVLQSLSRENQALQRKLRVLEQRHAEDMATCGRQEKKIKRLSDEMEALQHMQDASANTNNMQRPNANVATAAASHAAGSSQQPSIPTPSSSPASSSSSVMAHLSSSASPSPSPSTTATAVASALHVRPHAAHMMAATDCQYIDPNILKVLEKVDSQFSITNALALAAALKRWLHVCQHIVASTDLLTVLQLYLARVCELLHGQHAALFRVDRIAHRLRGVASERGDVSHWDLPLDKGLLGFTARENTICNVAHAYEDARFYSATDSITGSRSREVLCLPLTHELTTSSSSSSSSSSAGSSSSSCASTSVIAVLRVWNTTHGKPFTTNDLILAGLLATQAGTVLLQTEIAHNLQRMQKRVRQILAMPDELVQRTRAAVAMAAKTSAQEEDRHGASSNSSSNSYSNSSSSSGDPRGSRGQAELSLVHLVRVAQKKFVEIVGINKLRIFVLDAALGRVWHVGSRLEATTSTNAQLVPIRKYARVEATLCALLLPPPPSSSPPSSATADDMLQRDDSVAVAVDHEDDATLDGSSFGCRILEDPTAEPTFNDTMDLRGGAHGLYLAPIRSPWSETPLGMIQIARSSSSRLPPTMTKTTTTSDDPNSKSPSSDNCQAPLDAGLLALRDEQRHRQQVDDALVLQLVELFSRVLAGVLHHALALQLVSECPREVEDAQLAYRSRRLEWLEAEYLREQEEAETEAEALASTRSAIETTALAHALRVEQRERTGELLLGTTPSVSARAGSSGSSTSRYSSRSRPHSRAGGGRERDGLGMEEEEAAVCNRSGQKEEEEE